jgi:hypothetical protein
MMPSRMMMEMQSLMAQAVVVDKESLAKLIVNLETRPKSELLDRTITAIKAIQSVRY